MLFDMRLNGNAIQGWVSPDNPAKAPVVRVIRPDGTTLDVASNVVRFDVRDRGLHPTGENGFQIDAARFPQLTNELKLLRIVDVDTGILLYAPHDPRRHLPYKVFRFDSQTMPYAHVETAWHRNFTLYYSAVERHPFDTMFAILNNPVAESLALAGRPSFQRHGDFFQSRGFKIVMLLKRPLEEMAEKLLFIRYAFSSAAPKELRTHLTGLHPLGLSVQNVDFDSVESMRDFFESLSYQQRAALENPVVRALSCGVNEQASLRHVEISIAKLAGMDVVGVSDRAEDFSQMLADLFGRDIYEGALPHTPPAIQAVANKLAEVSAARRAVELDSQLYELATAAVKKALQLATKPEKSDGNSGARFTSATQGHSA